MYEDWIETNIKHLLCVKDSIGNSNGLNHFTDQILSNDNFIKCTASGKPEIHHYGT